MDRTDDWFMDLDMDGEVHVANPTEGVYVFYGNEEDEFIRTDCVVNLSNKW